MDLVEFHDQLCRVIYFSDTKLAKKLLICFSCCYLCRTRWTEQGESRRRIPGGAGRKQQTPGQERGLVGWLVEPGPRSPSSNPPWPQHWRRTERDRMDRCGGDARFWLHSCYFYMGGAISMINSSQGGHRQKWLIQIYCSNHLLCSHKIHILERNDLECPPIRLHIDPWMSSTPSIIWKVL